MADSRRPDDVVGRIAAALRSAASGALTAARACADRARPVLERFARRIAAILAAAASAAARSLRAAWGRLLADMRPGAESQASGASSAGEPAGGARRVFLVRRIVVLAVAALAVVALVVAVVCGVRALSGNANAGVTAQSGASGTNGGAGTGGAVGADTGDDGNDGGDGSDHDGTDGDDANAADPAVPTPVTPLSDAERADILARAQSAAAASGNPQVEYTYCIATQGDVGETSDFETIVYTALNDPQGWPRAGATFVPGSDDVCDMTLILASPDQMTTFSEECSEEYSCRVGDSVVINVTRWNGATDEWLAAGGTVDRYRVMVVNHEVGHRLGHFDNETVCGGEGQPAPLMQQQSMGLQGCVPNEWPLDDELWVSE